MQPKFLLLTLLIAANFYSQAQNGSPYWSLSGNNNAASNSILGTTNATPLNLSTNNLTRIYVAPDGKVGIGTTTPTSLFNVEGQTLLSIFTSTDALSTTSGSGMVGYTKFQPTAAGQRLGYFLTGSQGGGSNPGNGTGMAGYSDGAWSNSSHPAYLTFETTKTGSTARSEAMRIGSKGYVGIGTAAPGWRLHVVDSSLAVYANATSATGIGVYAVGNDAVFANGTSSGVRAQGVATGVYGQGGQYGVYGTGQQYGVYGFAQMAVYGSTGTIGGGSGVWGDARGPSSYGGLFSSAYYIGLFARTDNASTYAAYFQGNVFATGTYTPSDQKLKKNIVDFVDAVSIIKKLKPKSYEYLTEGKMAEMNLPTGTHYGLVAQDLEKVLPNLVKVTEQNPRHDSISKAGGTGSSASAKEETFKAVNYTELIPILVKGMQEQDEKLQKMEALEEKVQTLQAAVDKLTAMLSNNTTGFLSSTSLDVPVPNPAKGNTNIRYSIPVGTASARLTVVNMLGQVMKEVKLTGGAGQVNLNVSGLAAGTYPCTLWVNGQQAISKQLVVAH